MLRGLLVVSCASCFVVACTSTDDTYGGGGSGSGSYSFDAAIYQPSCDQECRDYLVGHGLHDTVLLLYNLNVVGMPSGSVDFMASCPLGGTVNISGSTSTTTDGTTTLHLLYTLMACRNSDELYSLSFTGEAQLDGNFNNGDKGASEFTTLTVMGVDLQIEGTLKYEYADDPDVSESCGVAETSEFHAGDMYSTLRGAVCEREFSSSSAFDSGGGGGGGSGTGGGGDVDASVAADSGSPPGSGGLCVSSASGDCRTCTIDSVYTDCDTIENCCSLAGLGFCTDLTLGACIPCGSESDCDPGQLCCH